MDLYRKVRLACAEGMTDPRARIEAAFEVLVDRVYTALPMLRGYAYKMAELEKHLDMTDDGGL